MSCKKVVGCCLILGSLTLLYAMSKSDCCNIACLKRKGRQLTRKMDEFISNIDEDGLTKYKQSLVTEYNKLKHKIDNLTIKDIKDAGSEMIESILDSVEDLKNKLLTSS